MYYSHKCMPNYIYLMQSIQCSPNPLWGLGCYCFNIYDSVTWIQGVYYVEFENICRHTTIDVNVFVLRIDPTYWLMISMRIHMYTTIYSSYQRQLSLSTALHGILWKLKQISVCMPGSLTSIQSWATDNL